MKVIFIISSLLTVVLAQEHFLNCSFFSIPPDIYRCDLTINNPNGLNNFTEITGTHEENRTNADVVHISRVNGVTTNIPTIICDTFPNLSRFSLLNSQMTSIDDYAFTNCSRITEIHLNVNRISSVSANAFANLPELELIDLGNSLITTLPANVFAGLQTVRSLALHNNPLEGFPSGIFGPLENLQTLYLQNGNLNGINNQWFANNSRLNLLYLSSNNINEIPVGIFAEVPNLETLYLYENNITELRADTFSGLENLDALYLSNNPLEVIHDGAFRGLSNLDRLYLDNCRVRQLFSNSFEGLSSLYYINLNYNQLEEIEGAFFPMENIVNVGLWNNRLKTLRRTSFGNLSSLYLLDLEQNVVNAIDRTIIEDAENLQTLYLGRNLCVTSSFSNFASNRAQYLQMLDRCFTNARDSIDAITEDDNEYSFFEAPQSGITFGVNTDDEIHIALTPFNFVWNPLVEIFIGAENNTRSIIRVNQETDVLVVPTPNILSRTLRNDFRVTWQNQVILVYNGNEEFPFLGFTMSGFFPVQFYGLRALETRATWTVQPF